MELTKLACIIFSISQNSVITEQFQEQGSFLQISVKGRNLFLDENVVLTWSSELQRGDNSHLSILLYFGFLGSLFCVWDAYQGVSLGQYLWGRGKHRIDQGRNLAMMWASSLSQHLRELWSWHGSSEFSPCTKMAKWQCFLKNFCVNQSLSLDHPQKGMILAKTFLVCTWGDSGRDHSSRLWATSLPSHKRDLGGTSSRPQHILHFSFFLLPVSLIHSRDINVCFPCASHNLNEPNKVLVLKELISKGKKNNKNSS